MFSYFPAFEAEDSAPDIKELLYPGLDSAWQPSFQSRIVPQTLRNYCIQAWTLLGSQPSRVLQSQLQPRPTVDPQLDVFDVFNVFDVFEPFP